MTRRESAIVSAYTGVLIGWWDDFHRYAEEKMGRPVLTHELASRELMDELKELSRPDFVAINITED